jgi:SagB-type dehydrogenase family enzyme
MRNRDLEATWAYHAGTKHSYTSVRRSGHYLDWKNQPLPFKIYSTLEPIPLPREIPPSAGAALDAISAAGSPAQGDRIPDLRMLARFLSFSAGITKRRKYPGGELLFRAAACTGALYHIELYLVCGELPDLQAGVYHFSVHDLALRKLRPGDFRREAVQAAAGAPVAAGAPAILACTSTYWRNAWKYQARAYRHCFWDNGTILANLLAVAAASDMPAQVIAGFVDGAVNRLLSLDARREVTLTLVPLGRGGTPAGPSPEAPPLLFDVMPVSRTEVDYPEIRAMHAASSLEDQGEVAAWRGAPPRPALPVPAGRLFPLAPFGEQELPREPIERVILRRGSARRFSREPMTFAQLSTILHRATRGLPADFLEPRGGTLNDFYLIVHAVSDLPCGAYVFRRDRAALELLEEGDFRARAGYLGLEQALPADASVDVFFLADLRPILERFGNRGYRATQLEAGIVGGKLYLCSYALGLGASGLTFYDDDVTAFFSPHAEGKSAIFLVALGVPARNHL